MATDGQGLNERPAWELRERIGRGEISAREVTQACLDAIEERDPRINAYITVDETGALDQADAVDRAIADGQEVGSLAGIPVALKDLICTRGLLTTCGSRILENFSAMS